MPDEIEEQDQVGDRFEAAIAAFEAQLRPDDTGTIIITGDADAMAIDPETLSQLTDCLAEANNSIAAGELALAEVSLTTSGEAYA